MLTSQYPGDDDHLVESWSAAWSWPTPSRLLVWVDCPHTPGSVSTHSDTLYYGHTLYTLVQKMKCINLRFLNWIFLGSKNS